MNDPGFGTPHLFPVDEYNWAARPRHSSAPATVRHQGEDLTTWLDHCTEDLRQTLERVWRRAPAYNLKSPEKPVLRPKQERLLQLLRDHGAMVPADLGSAPGLSKQGSLDLLRPLLAAGVVEKNRNQKNRTPPPVLPMNARTAASLRNHLTLNPRLETAI